MKKFDAPFGHVEVYGGNGSFSASVLVIYPGKEIPAEYHEKMTEIEFVLEGELEFRGKKIRKGDLNIYKPGQVHGYKNNTNENARILCITIPPYDPNDVFEVKE